MDCSHRKGETIQQNIRRTCNGHSDKKRKIHKQPKDAERPGRKWNRMQNFIYLRVLLGYLQRGIEIDGSFLKEVAERVVHRNVYEVYLHHLGMLRQHSSHAAIVLKQFSQFSSNCFDEVLNSQNTLTDNNMGQYGKQKEKLLLTTETNFLTNLIIMGNSEPSEHDINELHICDMPDRYFADEDCLDQKASLESEMEGWVVCEYPYYEQRY